MKRTPKFQLTKTAAATSLVFSLLVGTGCGGGSESTDATDPTSTETTTSAEDQLKNKLVFVAQATIYNADPATIAQAATLARLVSSGSAFDAAVVKEKFELARKDLETWAATARGSRLDTQVNAFKFTAQRLNEVVADSQRLVLQAMGTTFASYAAGGSTVGAQTTVFTPGSVPPSAEWAELNKVNYEAVLDNLYSSCQKNAITRAACDRAFAVNVSMSYAERCAKTAESWCTTLRDSLLKPNQADVLRTRIATLTSNLQGLAYACAQGKTECAAEDQTLKNGAKAVAVVTQLSRGLEFIGAISSNQVDQYKAVAEGMAAIYVHSAKAYGILRAADPLDIWDQATKLENWGALIFGDAKESGGLNLSIQDIQSLVGAFTGIEGAVTGIIKVFGPSLGGGNADAQILAGIKAIQDMIRALQVNMTARFDSVDYQLASLSVQMVDGLGTVNGNILDVGVKQDAALAALASLSSSLVRMDAQMSAAIADLSKQFLVGVQSIERDAGQGEYASDLVSIFNWTYASSIDATGSSAVFGFNYLDDVYDQLSGHSTGYNLNYMNGVAAAYTGAFLASDRVPNPELVVFGTRKYLDILRLRPAYFQAAAPMVARELQTLLTERIIPAQNFTIAMQNSTLIDELFKAYLARLSELDEAIKASAPAFQRSRSPVGLDFSLVGMWGADDQATSYVPKFYRLNKLVPCSGTMGPTLSMISNWQSLTDSVSLNAEALGVSELSVCYSLPLSNNGWGTYWPEKIKIDRYWAWGGLDLSINSYIGTTSLRTKLLAVPDAAGRGYLHQQRVGICFFFTTGDLRVATSAVPASTVVATAWETGTKFVGNDWCAGAGVVPANLSAIFSSSAVTTADWAETASRITVFDQIKTTRDALRRDFYGITAQALRVKSGDVGAAANRLDGAWLALRTALEIAYPQAMVDNLGFRLAFFGNQALPDSGVVADLVGTANPSTVTPVDIQSLAQNRADGLKLLVDAEAARVKTGQAKYLNPALDNLRIEVELWIGAANAVQ